MEDASTALSILVQYSTGMIADPSSRCHATVVVVEVILSIPIFFQKIDVDLQHIQKITDDLANIQAQLRSPI